MVQKVNADEMKSAIIEGPGFQPGSFLFTSLISNQEIPVRNAIE